MLPKDTKKTDVDELIRLAEWARRSGFRIGAVRIGALSLQIEDLRLEASEDLKGRPQVGIWEAAGMEGDLPADGTVGR